MKKITIVMPNYNKSEYIDRAVKSVLTQTYENIELIIVDDASTDNSRAYLQRYVNNGDNIKVIFLAQNHGVSYARNIGIMAAKGEYISFLDSDDIYYDKDKIKNEYRLIEEKGNDIIAYSKTIFLDSKCEHMLDVQIKNKYILNGNIFKHLMVGKHFEVVPREYLCSKENIIKVGLFNESMSLYEDLDLLCRLSLQYKFFSTYKPGTGYRESVKGLSTVDWREHKKVRNDIFNTYIKKVKPRTRILIVLDKFFFEKSSAIKRRINKWI